MIRRNPGVGLGGAVREREVMSLDRGCTGPEADVCGGKRTLGSGGRDAHLCACQRPCQWQFNGRTRPD